MSNSAKNEPMGSSRHEMPFGAAILADGSARFRLWAPGAGQVELCLEPGVNNPRCLPMTADSDGWFALTTTRAHSGSRYLYHIDGEHFVPDPASRFQPEDVHGPSELIEPLAWRWSDSSWRGRPWHEAVIYELHVGTFTAAGGFAAVRAKLDYLARLGASAIELMPVADFPGRRNWGYDGVALFAPDNRYGRPEDLKALVDAAHERGLMILLDVVYNHFGPEGNYLHRYAPHFFNARHHTPWGAAINFDGPDCHWVREFFIHNALYWLEEYHFDGLRLDAVHAIRDASHPDILTQLAERVHSAFRGRREVHLVLENDHNAAHYLTRDVDRRARWYAAQWNDDLHHALHVLVTGETDGYYVDYTPDPLHHLGRTLSEGFSYQGERSVFRDGQPRGEPSDALPPQAFVDFIQNHDQVGNRAFGERIDTLATPARVHAALALLLLAPAPPLLFMGQEWGCRQPFPYFCDFGADIAARVSAGRRNEFARSAGFRDPAARRRIPDPADARTFTSAILDWQALDTREHAVRFERHRHLLTLRHRELLPLLAGGCATCAGWARLDERALQVTWRLAHQASLRLYANLGDTAVTGVDLPAEPCLYSTHPESAHREPEAPLPPWCVTWYLQPRHSAT